MTLWPLLRSFSAPSPGVVLHGEAALGGVALGLARLAAGSPAGLVAGDVSVGESPSGSWCVGYRGHYWGTRRPGTREGVRAEVLRLAWRLLPAVRVLRA